MEIAGQPIVYSNSPNLRYDISESALQSAIRAVPAFSSFRVEREGDPKYGC